MAGFTQLDPTASQYPPTLKRLAIGFLRAYNEEKYMLSVEHTTEKISTELYEAMLASIEKDEIHLSNLLTEINVINRQEK